MDYEKREKKKSNPRQNANPLSAIMFTLVTLLIKIIKLYNSFVFSYMFPIFKRAMKAGLKEEDLFEPLDEHKSSIIGDDLEKTWMNEYKTHKKTALHRALLKCFGWEFFICSAFRDFVELTYMIAMPMAIGYLVMYFNAGQTTLTKNDAYFYAGIIILVLLLDQFISHPSVMGLTHNAMKMRVSCCSLIYRKSLRLSRVALGKTTLGQLVNLLSNDVSKFDEGFILAHQAWLAPTQVAIAIYLLYRQINVSAFIGITFLLLFIPGQCEYAY